jgi:ankyrin repeat protein
LKGIDMKKNILNLSTLSLILSLCAALPLKAASAFTLGNLGQLPTEVINNIMQFLCGRDIHTFAGLNKENAQLMRDHFTAVNAQLRRHRFLAAASNADVKAYAREVIKYGKAPAATHDALRAAARRGDVVAVQRLLTAPYLDVNHADNRGDTALILAAQNGHEAVVAQLLAAPEINVNHADKSGNTALMWAARWGHAAVVARLLAAPGINVNHANEYGQTALSLAARNGHAAVVEQLLAVDRIDVNHADEYGETALSLAACNGHAEVEAMLRAAAAQSMLSWCSVQ